MSDYDDYENNLFFEPTGDMSKLNDCNDGKRGSDVLVTTLEKCQKIVAKNVELEKKLKIIDDVISDVEMWFAGMVGAMNNECADHNKNLPIGNFEQVFRAYANSLSDLRKMIKE